MRKRLFIIGMAMAVVSLLAAPSYASVIFSDNFASIAGWSSSGLVATSSASPDSPAGNPYALFSSASDDSSLSRSVSTLGYTGIQLQYYRKVANFEGSSDIFRVEWRPSAGSWTTLETPTNTTWGQSALLPLGGSADNTAIELKFTLDTPNANPNGAHADDQAFLDQVQLIDGFSAGASIPEPVSLSFLGFGLLGLTRKFFKKSV